MTRTDQEYSSLAPGAVGVLGAALAIGVTTAVMVLGLGEASSLLLAAAAYLAAGFLVGRRNRRAPGTALAILLAPAVALYALMALNAGVSVLVGIPGAALLGAGAGVLAGYRSPGRSTSGSGNVE